MSLTLLIAAILVTCHVTAPTHTLYLRPHTWCTQVGYLHVGCWDCFRSATLVAPLVLSRWSHNRSSTFQYLSWCLPSRSRSSSLPTTSSQLTAKESKCSLRSMVSPLPCDSCQASIGCSSLCNSLSLCALTATNQALSSMKRWLREVQTAWATESNLERLSSKMSIDIVSSQVHSTQWVLGFHESIAKSPKMQRRHIIALWSPTSWHF